MKKLLVLSLVAAIGLSSCSKKEDEAQKAADQMQKSMEQMGQAMQAQGNAQTQHASGVAIPAKTLMTFLPDVSGYTKDGEAEYMDMEMQGTKYSHASQSYSNGDKHLKVAIFDYNFIAGLSAAYGMLLNMNMETNTEITRSEKFNGYPGWFNWHKQSNEGSIGVVVNDRVFVVIDGNGGISDADLHSLANAVNYSGIAGQVK